MAKNTSINPRSRIQGEFIDSYTTTLALATDDGEDDGKVCVRFCRDKKLIGILTLSLEDTLQLANDLQEIIGSELGA